MREDDPLISGAIEIIGDLRLRLKEAADEGRPLRVKVGFDPTYISATRLSSASSGSFKTRDTPSPSLSAIRPDGVKNGRVSRAKRCYPRPRRDLPLLRPPLVEEPSIDWGIEDEAVGGWEFNAHQNNAR
jgi:hypothetical protein